MRRLALAALLLGAFASCGLLRSMERAADSTDRLATTLDQKVAPAVVSLAASTQRTTDSLGDAADWAKGHKSEIAAWLALLLTGGKTMYRRLRGLTMVPRAKAPKKGRK